MNTSIIRISAVSLLLLLAWPGQSATPVQALSKAEQDTLLFMREEEKLARDVYITFYTLQQQKVFNNIASSEQRHMDAILKKIKLFKLADPALPEIGQFNHPQLRALYNQFLAWIKQHKPSYIEALTVGATIEDLDINDLNAAIAATDNVTLKTTYQNLLEASKQHLRTFVGLLRQQGSDYQPRYISPELFTAILDV